MKLKDFFLDAYRKAGVEPPKAKEPTTSEKKQPNHNRRDNKSTFKKSAPHKKGTKKMFIRKDQDIKSNKTQTIPANTAPVSERVIRTNKDTPKEELSGGAKMAIKHGQVMKAMNDKIARKKQEEADQTPFSEQFTMKVGEKAQGLWEKSNNDTNLKLLPYWGLPIPSRAGKEDVELSIGLDLGTSTVKVIIGDKGLQKAFVVPFFETEDSNRYLLPTRLYLSNREARLDNGDECYSDMKMRLLDSKDDPENQIRTTLFLALVLRHAINWILNEHSAVYVNKGIVWRLAIGIPSIHLDKHESVYRKFIQTAWLMAHSPQKLTIALASASSRDISEQLSAKPDCNPKNIDYAIVPEIAAQIFGYVYSDGFDPHNQKAILLVDVGAGTVDAAVFRPTKAKGKTNYDFYTVTVEENGVNMLHRLRLKWWGEALNQLKTPKSELAHKANEAKTTQQALSRIPNSVTDYFSEIKVKFKEPEFSPDHKFFKAFHRQVVTNTLRQTENEGHWNQDELLDIPFYLCGGGSRMDFYKKLQADLATGNKSVNWLKAIPMKLVKPKNLVADYLAEEDFDRLTVAYGLSFDDVGKVIKHLPTPSQIKTSLINRSWWDKYPEQ